MVESKENWKEIIKRAEDTGCDGLELNFGCPHGMCEGGMGRAVGQEPKVLEEITRWAMEYAQTPVIIKLTPNTSDINAGEAVERGGAPAISLINTVVALESIDRFVPTHGGNNPPLLRPRGQTHKFFDGCAHQKSCHQTSDLSMAESRTGAMRPSSLGELSRSALRYALRHRIVGHDGGALRLSGQQVDEVSQRAGAPLGPAEGRVDPIQPRARINPVSCTGATCHWYGWRPPAS